MVSVTRKGAAVLDQHIPERIKQAYHVLQLVCGFIQFFLPLISMYLCLPCMGVDALQF